MSDIASINELAETWGFYVWHTGWQASLVALLILGTVYCLRRAPSPLRYGLLLIALAKFVMPPLLTAPTGLFSRVPVQAQEVPSSLRNWADPGPTQSLQNTVPAIYGNALSSDPMSPEARPAAVDVASPSAPHTSAALTPIRENLSFSAYVMLNHIFGMGLFGVWLALLLIRLMRRAAQSTRLTDGVVYEQFNQVAQALGLRRPVRLLLSKHATTPIAFGVFRPTVMLPNHFADDLSKDQLNTVFAHELGHHRRLDLYVNHVQLLILAAWWFNPLVWLLNWALRRAREECCDDLVLGLGVATHLSYSETLVGLATHLPARSSLGAALGLAETFHPLNQRIKRIVNAAHPHPVRLSLLGLALVLLTGGTLLPGLRSGQDEAQAREESSPESELATTIPENTELSADRLSPEPNLTPETLEAPDKQKQASVHGQILFGTDKGPVPSAIVHLLKRSRASASSQAIDVKSDAQGGFVFRNVAPGEYRIWATHGAMVSRQKRYETPIVKVGEGGIVAEPIVLHLHRACVLRVKAISSVTGKPLHEAQVFLPWSDVGHYFPADENGVVVIRPLTQEPWHYEVIAPGHGRVTRTAKLQPDMESTFEVRLPAGGTLAGRVTDPDNRGIAGVGVNLYPTGNGRPLDYVITGKDGTYQLPYVPIHTPVDVRYHHDSFVSASKRNVALTNPNEVRVLDVQLKPTPLGGSVTGIVTNEKGQGIAKARAIFHTGSSDDIRRVRTDASGRFRMDDIPHRPGFMLMTIRAQGYAPKNIEIKPGKPQAPQDLSIQLLPGHTIAGRVVNAAGKPIQGVWVHAGGNRFPNRMGGRTHTDQDGRFTFDSLLSAIGFDFEAQGYSDLRNQSLELDRDDHVIVMQAHGIIAGQIVDAETGAPVTSFHIKVRRSEDEYESSLPSALYRGVDVNSEQGRFHLDGLTTGAAMMLYVKVPDNAVQIYDRVVAQAAPKIKPVTLKYQKKTGLLAGLITGMANHALPNLKVHVVVYRPAPRDNLYRFDWGMLNSGQLAIQHPIIQVQETVTDAEGRFEFKGVPPGFAVDLMIQGEGIPKTRRERIDILPLAEQAQMRIRLPKASIVIGKIYADVSQLSVHREGDGFSRRTININPDQPGYAFNDLEAGSYVLTIYGKTRVNNFAGTFSKERIGTIYFDIEPAQTKEIDILIADPSQRGDVPSHDAESPDGKAQGPGGGIVDGLQVHLWTDKQVWPRGEVPKFTANVLVVGEGKLGFLDPPMGVTLEYDGTEYGVKAAGALSIPHPPLRTAIYGLEFNLNADHYRDSRNQSFVLTPGKLTIRLIMFAQAPEGSTAESKPVYSNPVEIVIGA